MTDPEVTRRDPWAAASPAVPGVPLTGQDLAAVAPRRRRRWPLFTFAALVLVAGLAAALVAWAPWVPPPVLRPAGLVAGPATANSITFRWSRPRSGPLPDKYLILSIGMAGGSVAGTVTSYRQGGLTPATTYQYRVVAVRGGKRSPQSALMTVRTLTPPVSQARLQGAWNVGVRYIQRVFDRRSDTLSWEVIPVCAAGACDAMLRVKGFDHPFSVRLTRAGAVYQGHALAATRCGTGANSFPDPTALKFRIRVTHALGEGQVWAATSFAGTMAGSAQYVSSAGFYCTASTFKAALSGSPS